MLLIKWIGKRAVGNLGSADILLIVAMGSAVGDAMFYPTIPLAVALTVISLVAAFQKLVVDLQIKYESVRKLTHLPTTKLVENGKLLKENFPAADIDNEDVLMLLRQSGIRDLSVVQHAYYERSGALSIFKYENGNLITSILPEDIEDIDTFSSKK
ncbi:DUF421 domain-containing protein [Gelidibacter algens]|nr:YetF domain-containing protein [Gelidibacter algens]